MSADLLSFAFPDADEDHLVRVVVIDGEPWFVAKDVCAVLGIKNYRDAVSPLDDDEKGVGSTDTNGGDQQMLVMSESGLYTLVVRSRAATTPGTVQHRFRKWVTAEVLPQIRKTGQYAPEAGAGFDWDEIGVKVRLVREARLVAGRKAAQVLWDEIGLPPLEVKPREAGERPVQGVDFVQQFLDECTEDSPAGRVQAAHLYDAYDAWAQENGSPQMTQTAFGRTLMALGMSRVMPAGRRFYTGIRLKHRSEIAN